jgi:hypothetical protein
LKRSGPGLKTPKCRFIISKDISEEPNYYFYDTNKLVPTPIKLASIVKRKIKFTSGSKSSMSIMKSGALKLVKLSIRRLTSTEKNKLRFMKSQVPGVGEKNATLRERNITTLHA